MARDLDDSQLQDMVYALAASPNFAVDGVCFAARQSGLYRSDDGGRTWRSLFEVLRLEALLPATSVALSPGFESDGAVFAGDLSPWKARILLMLALPITKDQQKLQSYFDK